MLHHTYNHYAYKSRVVVVVKPDLDLRSLSEILENQVLRQTELTSGLVIFFPPFL